MGEIIQNTAQLLYHYSEEIIYKLPNYWKPFSVTIKDKKIVRQYKRTKYSNYVAIDFVNKVVKISDDYNITKMLVRDIIGLNNKNKNKAKIYIGNYGEDVAISENGISIIDVHNDITGIPAAITSPLIPDSNMFLIYHEDKLLFVL